MTKRVNFNRFDTMHTNTRTRHITTSAKAKRSFIPKTFSKIPALLRKRSMYRPVQNIKAELAARTLYVIDGDEIVITSLDRKPFCCQEELACMQRSALCRVARELNKKLPRALRIGPLAHLPEATIRCRIEEMMGFRHFHHPAQIRALSSPHKRVSEPAVSMTDLGTLLARHSQQIQRSPRSSFSSTSSRSSVPTSLDSVAESDEETGDRDLWMDIIRTKNSQI